MLTPGTLFPDMKLETAFSMAARFSAVGPFCCAQATDRQERQESNMYRKGRRKRFIDAGFICKFTKSPRAGVYPKTGMPETVLEGRSCSESVTPLPAGKR